MSARLKNLLLYIPFAINILLTIIGFYYLYASPYTGLMVTIRNKQAFITGVDKGSPAYEAGINKGDVLLDVEGMSLPYFVFSPDPDYINLRAQYRLFWQSFRKLNEIVKKDKPLELFLKRGETIIKFIIKPSYFPFSKAFSRTLSTYIVGWVFMIISFLILRKKINETSVANFIIGAGVCTSLISFAPYTVRDLSYPYTIFRVIKETNYLGSLLAPFAFIHLILVFPRKRPLLEKYPWLIKAVYGALCLVFIIHYAEVFENIHLTIYLPISLCLLGFMSWLLYDFFREKNPIFKKQIQWVVFGLAMGISAWLALTALPVMFGAPLLSEELSLLPAVLIPLSFAFAITRYRLMDIDSLFDYAVIYGATILILEGIELTFWGIFSSYLTAADMRMPFVSLVAVLLIVFIYMPVRNMIMKGVDWLFRRGTYDVEHQIQQFIVTLSRCDEISSLEKFASFVNGLLGPSGSCILREGREIVYVDSENAKTKVVCISEPEELKKYFLKHKQACFGYEISDAGVTIGDGLESAFFVPIFANKELYIAVFFEKRNRTAYNRKDCALLNALSINIGNIIEAEQLRKEKLAIEEEFNKQKDYVIKEMHDGLGNMLTNIAVASQVAESSFDNNRLKAKEMITCIREHSQVAMEFMRAGFSVLDNPEGTMGIVISNLRHRYCGLLESYGISLQFFVQNDVEIIRLGAKENLNLIRVIQEAMSNILRHSGSKNVEISFFKEGTNLNVLIRDNGKGFDEIDAKKGFGLKNMRQRIEALGGSFRIKFKSGAGTEIFLSIPIKSPAKGIEQEKALA